MNSIIKPLGAVVFLFLALIGARFVNWAWDLFLLLITITYLAIIWPGYFKPTQKSDPINNQG